MLFVIHAFDHPDQRDLRRTHTEAHVAYLKAQPLKICLAGPLISDDGESVVGSLLIVDAPDRAHVKAFNAQDPYTQADLFARVEITRLRKTMGWLD